MCGTVGDMTIKFCVCVCVCVWMWMWEEESRRRSRREERREWEEKYTQSCALSETHTHAGPSSSLQITHDPCLNPHWAALPLSQCPIYLGSLSGACTQYASLEKQERDRKRRREWEKSKWHGGKCDICNRASCLRPTLARPRWVFNTMITERWSQSSASQNIGSSSRITRKPHILQKGVWENKAGFFFWFFFSNEPFIPESMITNTQTWAAF